VKKFSKIPAPDFMEAAKRYMEGRIQ